MISVQNRQQQLSGNKLFYLFAVVTIFAACSPKVIKPVVVKKPVVKPVEVVKKPEVKKFTQGNIAVFIPFKLNKINLNTLTKAQASGADMPINFYQGLMMGIDSAANTGLSFKVNVFDSRDDNSQLSGLMKRDAVKNSNLLIGPVFPDGVKYMAEFSEANKLPLISPLAASKPSEFNNPYLISVVNDIDQHGTKIAEYIAKKYKADQSIVVLINTKKNSDEQFAAPIRNAFAKQYPNFIVQEYTSTYVFETKMVKGEKYAVVLCSDDAAFVSPSLTKIYRLKNLPTDGYDIQLFGHPNWAKQTYNVDQLQSLNTIVTSSYHIDYKRKAVVDFIKNYRAKYEFEPTEYSFKGFDIGFYFGKLMAKYGVDYLDFLVKENYKGLHNDFDFGYDATYGFYNKHLMLLQYKNLALNEVE